MARRASILLVIFALLQVTFTSCEKEEKEDKLSVKFLNESASTYTITSIKIRNRGKVDLQSEPTSEWSSNLLNIGETLAPGEFINFELNIPSGEWAEYQLGVDNGSGVEVMLYDQPNYDGFTNLPITHWGGDKRLVTVTITYDEDTDTITVSGWTDWIEG
ncbi:MAG TPA: hypothetical protein P5145_06575 [Tenuifilaceae bacterium]|nr:hypothetical protein [Tenuifilaceae bacterium]